MIVGMQPATESSLPPILRWTPLGRGVVFALSAMSIWCLLSEFYGLCSMRTFTFFILIPAMLALIVMAILDKTRGDRRLYKAVVIGALAGFVAACAYDIFRIPWVLGHIQQIGPDWLR